MNEEILYVMIIIIRVKKNTDFFPLIFHIRKTKTFKLVYTFYGLEIVAKPHGGQEGPWNPLIFLKKN